MLAKPMSFRSKFTLRCVRKTVCQSHNGFRREFEGPAVSVLDRTVRELTLPSML